MPPGGLERRYAGEGRAGRKVASYKVRQGSGEERGRAMELLSQHKTLPREHQTPTATTAHGFILLHPWVVVSTTHIKFMPRAGNCNAAVDKHLSSKDFWLTLSLVDHVFWYPPSWILEQAQCLHTEAHLPRVFRKCSCYHKAQTRPQSDKRAHRQKAIWHVAAPACIRPNSGCLSDIRDNTGTRREAASSGIEGVTNGGSFQC